jgi:poly-gamma-glutamate synthesis protein (capsule biosynthesis protein)
MALTLFAVGDIMLGETPLSLNFGVKSIAKKKGIQYFFKNVKKLFKRGDIVFGNLEAPLSELTEKIEFGADFFRGDPYAGVSLKQSNFSVLSVANNHIMEHGNDSFQKTINNLLQNEIIPIGMKNNIKLIKKNNYCIAFLAYSFIEDGIKKPLYNKIDSAEKIIADITSIRNDADFIILSLHWGDEYVPFPSPNQVSLGRQLIDSGADIILGSHPHVLQGYEIYKDRPIIYSLGNFIFENTFIPNTRYSAIACIQLDVYKRKINLKMIPVILDRQEYLPIIASGSLANIIVNYIEEFRKLLENRYVENYSADIGNYSKLIIKYKRSAKANMKVHYLKNILRYSPRYTLSVLCRHFQKRYFNYSQKKLKEEKK